MRRLLGVIVALVLGSASARADTLRISTDPPRATVEINGAKVGKTPFTMYVPGGYLPGAPLNAPFVEWDDQNAGPLAALGMTT